GHGRRDGRVVRRRVRLDRVAAEVPRTPLDAGVRLLPGRARRDLVRPPRRRRHRRHLGRRRGSGWADVRSMRVLSGNVGRPRPNPWKRLPATGIDTRPVEGPVAVTAPGPKGSGEVGLAGDRAHDVKHHGGADQAVYAYAREDLDRWAAELDR